MKGPRFMALGVLVRFGYGKIEVLLFEVSDLGAELVECIT